jgi:hypothetical protein
MAPRRNTEGRGMTKEELRARKLEYSLAFYGGYHNNK